MGDETTDTGTNTPEPRDFTGLSRDEVAAIADTAADKARELSASEDFSTEVEAEFETALAERQEALDELARRDADAERTASARQRAADLAVAPAAPVVPAAPAAPVAPAAPAEPTAPVPSVADMRRTAPAPVVPAAPQAKFAIRVPSDANGLVPGIASGGDYADFGQVGHAMERRISQYATVRDGGVSSHQLAQIHRDYGDLNVHRDDRDEAVIQHAISQSRLKGGNLMAAWNAAVKETGSLTAAAGWCAPSTTMYDLCELESLDGLLDIPEVNAIRGGVRWTQGTTYAELDAATTFTALTEAQVIAATPKTCSAIPCPTFTDTRLNIAATCVTGSFLQLRGYPEQVARFVRGAMVVHAHKLNEARIAAMVTQAGAATVIGAPAGDPVTSAVLSGAELAAVDIRYRNRMPFNAVIEVVLPQWVISLFRADWARRNVGDPAVSDAMLANWFAVRNIRPQFVYDWQDGYSGGGGTSPGGDGTPPYTTFFPQTVSFLAYPAGAVVSVVQDVVNLRNVYDAANLANNLYTELFFEEGWNLIYPCPDLRLYTVQSCPSGATAIQVDLDCAA